MSDNKTAETIERVVMNRINGNISIGIRISFFDKYQNHSLDNLEGYQISISSNKPEGWLIFAGRDNASGPWMFINLDKNIEDLGPL